MRQRCFIYLGYNNPVLAISDTNINSKYYETKLRQEAGLIQ